MRNSNKNGDQQLATLAALSELPVEQLTGEQLESVFAAAARPASPEVQMRAAVLLSQLYPKLAPKDSEFARRTHTVLLRDLRQPRKTLAHPSCSWLVMTHLREENLAHIPWQSAAEVVSAAECFYGLCGVGLTSEESHQRVRDLVKYAGHRFAEQGRWEEMFQLLSRIQLPTDLMDADLFRVRNALAIYEQKRVQRLRRSMFNLFAVSILFILIVSPLLFMFCENPDRGLHGLRALAFPDALYWSIITSATVGYGEIVPNTAHGRALAIFDCLVGMTLMGVVAGMILSHLTPRQLP